MGSGVMNARGARRRASCAEGAAAAAGVLRVRIVKDKPTREQRRVVVERGAPEKQVALPVHEDLCAVVFEHLVAGARHLLPREGVAQARTPAAFHAHTKTTVADALFLHQRLDLLGGGV